MLEKMIKDEKHKSIPRGGGYKEEQRGLGVETALWGADGVREKDIICLRDSMPSY